MEAAVDFTEGEEGFTAEDFTAPDSVVVVTGAPDLALA